MSKQRQRLFNGYYALRWKILERDKFTCQYCGQHAPNVTLEIDHLKTVADGGEDTEDNLITACRACNRGRSGLQIQQSRKGKQPAQSFHSREAPANPRYSSALDFFTKQLAETIVTPVVLAQALNIRRAYGDGLIHRLLAKGAIRRVSRGKYSRI